MVVFFLLVLEPCLSTEFGVMLDGFYFDLWSSEFCVFPIYVRFEFPEPWVPEDEPVFA